MFPCFWRENSAWEHVLFVYIMFSVFVNKLIDRSKVFYVVIDKKDTMLCFRTAFIRKYMSKM